MTTPNSLNKQMMSSWSITPDQRRNAQDYKTDTGTAFSHLYSTWVQIDAYAQISGGDTEHFMGARVAACSTVRCQLFTINKSNERLPFPFTLQTCTQKP